MLLFNNETPELVCLPQDLTFLSERIKKRPNGNDILKSNPDNLRIFESLHSEI